MSDPRNKLAYAPAADTISNDMNATIAQIAIIISNREYR